MIVVVVTLVSASVLGEMEALGATLMSLSTDRLHITLGSYLYSECFSNGVPILNLIELALP